MIIATLDRFGYELRVISDSKKMAEKCLIEEYKKKVIIIIIIVNQIKKN